MIAEMSNDENKKVKDLHERKLTEQKNNTLVEVTQYVDISYCIATHMYLDGLY